jgi:DNA invertase Pin-like site-specific DNA recombinase
VSSRGQNLDLQRHAIERAAAARGDRLAVVYVEKRTASVLKRPELDRLRIDIQAGQVHRLYVYRLDRLTRTGIRDTFDLVEEFRRYRCVLITASDGFDLNGPMAEPLIAMMAWAAKMENHARRERQAAARDRIEEAGGAWGRPARMSDAEVSQAGQLRAAGRSDRAIAVALKIPRATIRRALARGGSKCSAKTAPPVSTG